jgi:Tfp pilus assembly protein FimV
MTCPRGTPLVVGGLVLVALCWAIPSAGQNVPAREDPALALKQMLAFFDAWDLNKDGILDKGELALAFRGKGALPFDNPAALTLPAALASASAVSLAGPTPTPALNFAGAGLMTLPSLGGSSKANPVGMTALPDYQFLKLLSKKGKIGKAKLSRKTFASWAKKHARQLQKELKAQVTVQKAQAKVQKVQLELAKAQAKVKLAKTAKSLQSAQKEVQHKTQELARANASLQKHLQTLAKAAAQVADVPPVIRQVLLPRP